jgi:hypothetical protein
MAANNITIAANTKAYITNIKDSAGNSAALDSEAMLLGATLSGSANADFAVANDSMSRAYLNNCLSSSSLEMAGSSAANLIPFCNQRLISKDHDQTAGYEKHFTDGGIIDTSTTSPDSPATRWWVLSPLATYRDIHYPLDLSILSSYAKTLDPVTITLRMQKSHATGIIAGIRVKAGWCGLTTDQISLMSSTAGATETVTLTFTPLVIGAFTVEAIAYGGTTYTARFANVTAVQ